jgi:hypothetical protein
MDRTMETLQPKDFERSDCHKLLLTEFLGAVKDRGINYAIETMIDLFEWLPNKDHDIFIKHSLENDFTEVSECCNAPIKYGLCTTCKEHAESIYI